MEEPSARKAWGCYQGTITRALVAAGPVPVDVRTAQDHAAGHIDGTINIPLDDLASRFGKLDPTVVYLIYREHGVRSDTAV